MTFSDQTIIDEFVTESQEHLADIENQLLAIEAAGKDIDAELVNTVFRAVHSVKGAAGFLGFAAIGALAHSLENVLNLMRNEELVPTSPVVDALLKAADLLSTLMSDVNASNDVDVSAHVNTLDAIAAGNADRDASTDGEPVEPQPSAEPDAPKDANSSVDTSAPTTQDAATDTGPEPMSQSLNPESSNPESSNPQSSNPKSSNPQSSTTQRRERSNQQSQPADLPPVVATAPDKNIRVSVETLDRLMNLAGELVLSRNQLMQTVSTADKTAVDTVAARVDQVTSELQEAIMQTRMQPVGNVFTKFTRIVRDLSNRLGKRCQLSIEGKDVEVDKTVIEAIGDPLTHLIRNSVDHGIEMPDRRVAQGKPAIGTIHLHAFHQSGKVRIVIQDDGGGIDAAKIREKAVAKGVITPEAAAETSDQEAVRLIFHAGFSTAEQISDVSGRGVGMDVVRTNIERLGGIVDVESSVGLGTTISITLPLTLAIIPSLIVSCREHRYALPQVNISELVRIRPDDAADRIERVKDAEVIRLRGSLLPLVRLSDVFGNGTRERSATVQDTAVSVAVVEAGQTRYGLVIDELHDSEEIVVKPFGRHLNGIGFLSGATILGDGRVALILDALGIANSIALRSCDQDVAADEDECAGDVQSLLFFRNHPDEQFAVPSSIISRIEQVRADQLDAIGGQQILQYRGASLPVLSLEDHIQARPHVASEGKRKVIVFDVQGREVGLVVSSIEDIRDCETDIDTVTFGEPGVIGSFVREGKTVRLLDIFQLAKAARPEWFADREKVAESNEHGGPIVLLAEDSDFFRNQVRAYLEDINLRVVCCEDGQAAWETLKSGEHDVDLVVTDVEMPRMNGFQLCRRIKDDPAFEGLPVVALTSLAGQEDQRRGADAGVDEYQVKMDRERLLIAVQKLIVQSQSARGKAVDGKAADGKAAGKPGNKQLART